MTYIIKDLSHHQAKKLAPGVYRVVADFNAAVVAGADGFIIRSNYGTRIDTTAQEHHRRAAATGRPRCFYWYDLSRQNPQTQAETAFEQAGAVRGMRAWCDLEENRRADGADPVFAPRSVDYFNHVNAGLLRCDELSGEITDIYSNSFLDAWFSVAQQREWADAGRKLWTAHWAPPGPGVPYIPQGWRHLAVKWVLWQNEITPWPGFPEMVDGNVSNVGVSLAEIFGSYVNSLPPVPEPEPGPEPEPEPLPDLSGPLGRIDVAVGDIRGVL